jgi:hypothetical protein
MCAVPKIETIEQELTKLNLETRCEIVNRSGLVTQKESVSLKRSGNREPDDYQITNVNLYYIVRLMWR